LEVTREDVLGYLKRQNQGFREDKTNTSLDYDRNWVRHQLLPMLQERLGTGVAETLSRNATLFAEIDEFLDEEANTLLSKIGEKKKGELLIDLARLSQAPKALRKQLARLSVRFVKGNLLGITQNHIRAFLELSEGTSGKQIHLPGDVRVRREFGSLCVHKAIKETPNFRYEFQLPGELLIPEVGKRVEVKRVNARTHHVQSLLSTRIDSVIVRNRRPGDRFLESTGSYEKSLKRLFLAKRVPISSRDRLVMFEVEGKVVWIEGFAMNPLAKAGELESEGFEIDVGIETFGTSEPSK
jgi:tRNA(Ile)-lysidine synthase